MSGRRTPLVMPQLGETVSEGTIVEWLVAVGEQIGTGTPALSVSTDKVDTDIESPVEGVLLEILVVAGDTVPVGTVLAYVGEVVAAGRTPSDATDVLPGVASAPATAPIPSPARVPLVTSAGVGNGRRPAPRAAPRSPVVRRLSSELGVDLTTVRGTGRNGRITKLDVVSAAQNEARTPVPVPSRGASDVPRRRTVRMSIAIDLEAVDRTRGEERLTPYLVAAVARALSRSTDLRDLAEVIDVDGVACRDAGTLRVNGIAALLAAPPGGSATSNVTLSDRSSSALHSVEPSLAHGAALSFVLQPARCEVVPVVVHGSTALAVRRRAVLTATFTDALRPEAVEQVLTAAAEALHNNDWSDERSTWRAS